MSTRLHDIPKQNLIMRSCIQKVATGPEYSKDLSFEEAHAAMLHILEGKADPVQTAVFLIALRMKRETDEENGGVLQAILDTMKITTVEVDEVIDVADPYDGYTRGLAISPFLPAVFAACGLPAVCHGLEKVGPKFGVTHRKVLRAAGIHVDLTPEQVAAKIATPDIGWSYLDQKASCPALHALVPLRRRIVKRPVLTTVEVLSGPIRGKLKTHLMTGYVHKVYPPIYTYLARLAGFDTAAIIRGVEGGVIPSLKQTAKFHFYKEDSGDDLLEINPEDIGIEQATRAVPIPDDIPLAESRGDEIAATINIEKTAELAAETGIEALSGKPGPARDSLVYGCAIMLSHLGRSDSMATAADSVRKVLDSGKALTHFKAA